MIKKITFIFLLIQSVSFGQKIESINIDSKIMGQQRELMIYTPFGYGDDPDTIYDVFYVFDAQNRGLFDLTHSVLSFMNTGQKRFIVVGIPSQYIPELDYARSNDFLPELKTKAAQERWGTQAGNVDNFMRFVRDEVMTYMANHYSVGETRIGIGHSLSATFILYSLIKDYSLFNHYIAISPNLANDDDALVKQFEGYYYPGLPRQKFVYVSHATEETIKGWEAWKPARERFYQFLNNSVLVKSKLNVVIKPYPEEGHWSTFLPSLQNGLKEYFAYLERVGNTLSDEVYGVTISVKVPEKDDVVYITGNQAGLGNWDPGKIKMTRKSDFVREITLKLHSPAQFKFTKGSWVTEAIVSHFEGNIVIDPSLSTKQAYVISEWRH